MIFESSAWELAEKIREGEVSSQDVVDRHIRRIEEVNPKLNAVVETRFPEAMEMAKRADEKLAGLSKTDRETLPPLFGVPFTIKEMIAVEGMKSTSGSVHRKNQIMKKDGTVTRRLKNAGGILMGTTNIPEVGFWFECNNLVYGKTSNPYDITRTSGGSSGGEGSIIAAGASPFGVGSDIGGSVRIPAAFCGIFGHKASEGVLPFTGHEPIYEETAAECVGDAHPFTVLGPMSRRAKDLRRLMELMMGEDGFDSGMKKNFRLGAAPQIRDINVFTMPSPVMEMVSSTENDLSQAVVHAGRYLQEMGASTEELPENLFKRTFELWTARAWSVKERNFTDYLSDGHGINYKLEFAKKMLGGGTYTLPTLLTAFLNEFDGVRKDQSKNVDDLKKLRAEVSEILGKNGVIIMPVHPRKAPKHGSTIFRPFDFSHTGIFNALGFPATSVPMGLSDNGLPISVQVAAADGQDHLCLAVAEALEEGFGGWIKPQI